MVHERCVYFSGRINVLIHDEDEYLIHLLHHLDLFFQGEMIWVKTKSLDEINVINRETVNGIKFPDQEAVFFRQYAALWQRATAGRENGKDDAKSNDFLHAKPSFQGILL